MTTADTSFDRWRDRVRSELGSGRTEAELRTQLLEGFFVEPLYVERTERSGSDSWIARRGAWLERGGGSGCVLCPVADDPDIDALNATVRRGVSGGASAIWLRLDRTARWGVDPCASGSTGHIARGGTTAYSVSDLGRVLRGVSLERTALLLDVGGNAIPGAALLLAYLDEEGIDPSGLRVAFGWDPLGALARDGSLPRPMPALNEEAAMLTRWSAGLLPTARAVTVSTLPYHDGGAHGVDELAAAVATGIHYLRALSEFGLSPDAVAAHIVFQIGVGTDVFLEMAKLRALRLLWGGVLATSGVEEGDSSAPVVHAVTSNRSVTRSAPWVNSLRQTTELFAAMVGGADLATPRVVPVGMGVSPESAERIARNAMLTLEWEGRLTEVVDPAGGSYYLEALTNELAERAWDRVREIESHGGMVSALEEGRFQARVAESARIRRERVRSGDDALVGVTHYVPEESPLAELPDPLDDVARCARGRLDCTRESRVCNPAPEPLSVDCERARSSLDRLVRCAGCGATIGEISDALAPSGTGPSAEPIPERRVSEPFEDELERGDA